MNRGSLDFKPHPAQLEINNEFFNYKYFTVVCGRRFGKTMYFINKLSKLSWTDPGNYFYVLPTTKQAKRIAWKMLQNSVPDPFKPHKWKNEQELWIENLKGGRVTLLGSDDPDNLRGDKAKGYILDEYADMKPNVYSIIEPALGDEDGFCVFLGTPKGYNHFYEMFIKDIAYADPTYETYDGRQIIPDPLYKSFTFKTEDNPYFPKHRIDQARKNLTLEMFKQEYEANFENFTGLIYKEFMDLKDELILEPIYDPEGCVIGCKKKVQAFDDQGKVVIVLKDILFKNYWNYYHGADTGRYTACLFVCLDEEGNQYVFDEIFNIDGLVDDISIEVKFKIKGKNIKGAVIDSASQVKKEYRSRGINYQDSQKDILGSIEMMRSKMKLKKYFVLSNCRAHIKELCSRKWDDKKKMRVNGKKKNMPADGDDHTCNVAEYIELTFLKYPVKIITPAEREYKQSLENLVVSQPVKTWEDLG